MVTLRNVEEVIDMLQPRIDEATKFLPEPVWDCKEAAEFLGRHPKTVKRMAQAGEIPGCRFGKRWCFRPSGLDSLPRVLTNRRMPSAARRDR